MGMKNEQDVCCDAAAFSFRSVFDVLLDNLQKSRMQVHLYRVVYVGEHDCQHLDQLEPFFSDSTAKVNFGNDDTRDVLCALLIYYAKHFVLMLEGSEEAILRHLAILMSSTPPNSINRIFVLIMLRANQRLLEVTSEWRTMNLSGSESLQQQGRRMSTGEPWQKARVCVDKLHRLAGVLAVSDSNVSGPLSDKSMVPDAAALTQVIESGLLQSAAEFAKRLAPAAHLQNSDDHIWPPEI